MIVHGDIKPDSILLTKEKGSYNKIKAVISDFGIATKMECFPSSVTTEHKRGTYGWRAPELCTDLDIKAVRANFK